MRKIYVLDENNELKEIDAGITQYSELTDAPIYTTYDGVKLVGSTITLENDKMVVTQADGHKWGEEDTEEKLSELSIFCDNAASGRYDILTERFGTEILIIDRSNPEMPNRYRRITVDQDLIYDEAAGWISISDSSARELVFRISNQSEIPSAVVVGNRVALECYYYSTVANGTITIKKGEIVVAAANLEIGKTTTVNLTNAIQDGVNTFLIEVTNNNGEKSKIVYQQFIVTGIKLNYNPNFDIYQTRRDEVPFAFSYSGTGIKYIHFDITNSSGVTRSWEPESSYKDAGQGSTRIPAEYFSHGENIISTYMYMKNGDEILTKTDAKIYTFPYVEADKSTQPIVMTYYDFSTIQE